MADIYSVAQVTGYIKNMFTADYLLSRLSVRGELSNVKDHPSGHIYFTLKDRDASLSCVMFAGNRLRGLNFRMKDGMKVVVTGNVNIYETTGKYQLYAAKIEEDGRGDLYAEFLRLKEKLSEMGMFSEEYKKPIPKYARRVGIVTALSGAAIQDILRNASRRNPYTELILSPAQVQGDGAPQSIVRAIERLDRYGVDVMIVGRGGGSFEDLMAFNDEAVARAIFDCETPVISAVGHETDFTISDFVADLRVSTPTAAAEAAVYDYAAFENMLDQQLGRMETLVTHRLETLKKRLSDEQMTLRLRHPSNRLKEERDSLSRLSERFTETVSKLAGDRRQTLSLLSERLSGLSPLSKLKNGFGYISLGDKPLKSVSGTSAGDLLKIRLSDGAVTAKTLTTEVTDGG